MRIQTKQPTTYKPIPKAEWQEQSAPAPTQVSYDYASMNTQATVLG